ncbi:MAG: sialidase family protein [Thermoplasmatota archaeon]
MRAAAVRRLSPLFVAALLAGCMATTSGHDAVTPLSSNTTGTRTHAIGVDLWAGNGPNGPPRIVEAIPKCAPDCDEASIAVDALGHVVAVDGLGAHLGLSTDGGLTFAALGAVPIPAGAPSQAQGADSLLETDAAGRLYYVTPIIGANSPLLMIQVASSHTSGTTWDTNVLVGAGQAGHNNDLLTDRPWLGLAPDGKTVYLSYNNLATGVWMARSDDGGKTFGAFVPVTGQGLNVGPAAAGRPVVDSTGRVFLPYTADSSPAALAGFASNPAGGVLAIAISTDKGMTFQTITPGFPASTFPELAVGPGDRLYAAWTTGAAAYVSQSTDHGATWSKPTLLASDGVYEGPWVEATAGGAGVAYYEKESSGFALHFARVAAGANGLSISRDEKIVGGIPDQNAGSLSHGDNPWTDFAHFAYDANGCAKLIWVEYNASTVNATVCA